MKWSVGDHALVTCVGNCVRGCLPSAVGEECIIIGVSNLAYFDWFIDINGKSFSVRNCCLKPIEGPGSWVALENIWVPKVLERTT